MARLWHRCGHALALTGLDHQALRESAQALGPGVWVAGNREASLWAEAALLTVPWESLDAISGEATRDLAGKVLIDATNSVVFDPVRKGFRHLAPEGTRTALINRERFPGAILVKALNTIPAPTLEAYAAGQAPPFVVPLAGDDAAARAMVASLIRETGLYPEDLGPLAQAGEIEFGGGLWGVTRAPPVPGA